ncbi:MAG TPA: hypothetical protein VMG31_13835 [Verrucomicrobiae bacterium]|nr:hypothetical protein [Verrucomicrobiae bacterium]
MMVRGVRIRVSLAAVLVLLALAPVVQSRAQSSASSSSSSKRGKKSAAGESGPDAGIVNDGVYRNATFGFSYKIPEGWVLRTEEMNTDGGTTEGGCPHTCSTVLLAVFSRPPEATGQEVNSSILIAAESAAAYPGLKEAAQYFGPVTEVAKAQGFTVDQDPYEIALGSKALVRSDFHKDVGTRVMRQSTLVMLSHGYAVSITVISGTEDGVEDLIDGLEFTETPKKTN